MVVVVVWAFGMLYVFFRVQDAIRASAPREADELAGLDATEMGVLAYPDFAGSGPLGDGCARRASTGAAHPHPKPAGSEA